MSDRGGDKIFDLQNRLVGTMTNMDPATDWVDTEKGHALDFDGANDYVVVPNHTALQIAGKALTLVMTIYIRGTGDGGNGRLLDNSSGSSAGFGMRIPDDSTSLDWIINGSAYASNTGIISFNKWLRVVGVYNGVTTKIYVDGKDGGGTALTSDVVAATQNLYIGNRPDTTRPLTCQISDIQIFSRAWDAAEVRDDLINPYGTRANPRIGSRRSVGMVTSGGGGGTTRGMPFGHRGTAFNGGRTFQGIIQ